MRTVAIVALLLLAFGTLVGQCVLLVRLREHRVDLRLHEHFGQGSSAIWQVNVFRPGNYTPRGRRLLRRASVMQAAWFVELLLGAMFTGFL